jgi:hypothetical protein
MTTTLLAELASQIRGHTLHLLSGAPAAALLWTPSGTSNHLLWHAGHALWVQDVLCIEPLTGRSELPPEWSERFGQDCRPVAQTRDWPERVEVRQRLELQLHRLLELFEEHGPRLTSLTPDRAGEWELMRDLLHGLHDEARHQGEMYLLLKLHARQ